MSHNLTLFAAEKVTSVVKDSSLYLFHSLGKILYAKREQDIVERLPLHMKHLEKPPLQEQPEAVFERTCVSQDSFVNLLQTNASQFYDNIDSAADCLEWFSIGDYMTSLWDPTGATNALALSTTLRGVMFYLQKPKCKNTFNKFRKPSFNRKRVERRQVEIRRGFLDENVFTFDTLVKDTLPYLIKIRSKTAFHPEKWDNLNDCVSMRGAEVLSKASVAYLEEQFIPDDRVGANKKETVIADTKSSEMKELVVDMTSDAEVDIEEIDSS